MRNENMVSSFLALQDNKLLQQNDLLQKYRGISKALLDITSKFDSLMKQREESGCSGTEHLKSFRRRAQNFKQ